MAFTSGDARSESIETTRVHRAFDTWNEVPLVPQTTGMSCWAAAAAMLVGWRESLAVDPDELARGAGRWHEFQRGLHPVDVAALAAEWGLVMEQRDDIWEVDQFRALLEQQGPLWVGEASPGLHAIVVTGLFGDGTPDGTRARINDPWPVGGRALHAPSSRGCGELRGGLTPDRRPCSCSAYRRAITGSAGHVARGTHDTTRFTALTTGG